MRKNYKPYLWIVPNLALDQVMVFQDAVIDDKKRFLIEQGKRHLKAFTLDNPIFFQLTMLYYIKNLNEEMVQGPKGPKQGQFFVCLAD